MAGVFDVPRVAVFDDTFATGHSLSYTPSLVEAFANAGWDVAPLLPEGTLDDPSSVPIPNLTGRPRGDIDAHRQRTAALHAAASRIGPLDLVVDADLMRHYGVLRQVADLAPRSLHIVHRVRGWRPQVLLRGGRSARLASPNAHQIKRVLVPGRRMAVVHTPAAEADLSAVLGPSRVCLAGLFSPLRATPCAGKRRDPSCLVFLGDTRQEKGFEILLEALAGGDMGWRRLRVVGRQLPSLERVPFVGVVQVEWVGELGRLGMVEELRGAGTVVVAHRKSMGRRGAASGVLLDALAARCPVVASDALQPLVPTEAGVRWFRADDPMALRKALSTGAPEHGQWRPPTADEYVKTLLDSVGADGSS